jgi:integration host factor subunit beta
MIKSELITAIAIKKSHLSISDVELAVKCLIESMISELASGGRVEIRGFGSFSLRYRKPRMARNPINRHYFKIIKVKHKKIY